MSDAKILFQWHLNMGKILIELFWQPLSKDIVY